jgi:hypothetical protein
VSGFSRTFRVTGFHTCLASMLQPEIVDDFRSCCEAASRQQMSIAAVFGWPPTCAYADMNRLKSNKAIPRREFVPRDPCRTNQL